MSFLNWFQRRSPLTPDEMKTQLLQAVRSGSLQEVMQFCKHQRQGISQNIDSLTHLPEDVRNDDERHNEHVVALLTASEILNTKFSDPRMSRHPIIIWLKIIRDLPTLLDDMQYDEARSRLNWMISEASQSTHVDSPYYLALAHGRLGDCDFCDGRVQQACEETTAALSLCREQQDFAGVIAYLKNLVEIERYLGRPDRASLICNELSSEEERQGLTEDATRSRRYASRIAKGEPLNRVVVQFKTQLFELDELPPGIDGDCKFIFQRNRPNIPKAQLLTSLGCRLIGSGDPNGDGQKLLREASEVDPHDPMPHYQLAVALMEAGDWGAARQRLELVEQLAPGWFRCRSDHWLAVQIETGQLPPDAFQIIRKVEDSPCSSEERIRNCREALERFDTLAPLWLAYANALVKKNLLEEAIAAFRIGLQWAREPDVESRLLVELAAILPYASAKEERHDLRMRVLGLKGSLIAQAMAVVNELIDLAESTESNR